MTLLGKFIQAVLRAFGRKGTALPGLVIEKLSPGYVHKSLAKLPYGIIIVTGTNGKTTTTRIISKLYSAAGLRVVTNARGSNFVRGVIASIVKHATCTGKLLYDIGVFELDEAHALHLVKLHRPTGVVVLNIARDQMDRFGEIDKVATLLSQIVATARDWVVLNTNDPRVAKMAEETQQRVLFFGHDKSLAHVYSNDDQLYNQSSAFFQLVKPTVCLTSIKCREVSIRILDKNYTTKTILDGTHNASNITAALTACVAQLPEVNVDLFVNVIQTITPAFGRGERIILSNGSVIRLQVVKNPSGFRHALRLLQEEAYSSVGFAINDNYADGRDVSWLWDIDFSRVNKKYPKIFCGGTRATDMAIRLKYDGVQIDGIDTKFSTFLAWFSTSHDKPAIIFCTYTAMLQLRGLLKQQVKALTKYGL